MVSRTELIKSLHDFDPLVFGTLTELKNDLNSSLNTENHVVLLIACADQGMDPDNLSVADPAQLFVVQHMASSILKSGREYTDSSIEYAVNYLGVKHVIICGHLQCNLMMTWMQEMPSSSDIHNLLISPTLNLVTHKYENAVHDDRMSLLVREHILIQLENLQSYDFIKARLQEGQLRLHGWIVDDETARIKAFDPSTGQFVPVEDRL